MGIGWFGGAVGAVGGDLHTIVLGRTSEVREYRGRPYISYVHFLYEYRICESILFFVGTQVPTIPWHDGRKPMC